MISSLSYTIIDATLPKGRGIIPQNSHRRSTMNNTIRSFLVMIASTLSLQACAVSNHPDQLDSTAHEPSQAHESKEAVANTHDNSAVTHHDDNPRPYDATRDAKADVDAAFSRAQTSGKMPLLVMGANWCHDSRGLAGRFEKPEFTSLINEHYELVYIDVGKRDKNLDIAKKFGIHEIIGTPTVLVLTSTGELLNQDSAALWRRADSVSDEVTYSYFKTFAEGGTWTKNLD